MRTRIQFPFDSSVKKESEFGFCLCNFAVKGIIVVESACETTFVFLGLEPKLTAVSYRFRLDDSLFEKEWIILSLCENSQAILLLRKKLTCGRSHAFVPICLDPITSVFSGVGFLLFSSQQLVFCPIELLLHSSRFVVISP